MMRLILCLATCCCRLSLGIFASLCIAVSAFSEQITKNDIDIKSIDCLRKSYSEFLLQNSNESQLESRNGHIFIFDEHLIAPKIMTHDWLLEHADLKAQMSQPYSTKNLDEAPELNVEPGRLRSQSFFDAMYGTSSVEVRKHLRKVWWEPCQCMMQFSILNGAADALEKVGQEIIKDPNLINYVNKPLGSFNWRVIAGTKRRSMHAYGVAIDFSLPHELGQYWGWQSCKGQRPCNFPESVLHNKSLHKIVRIFETKGFIWGGKWYHFDTLHFEYRPELTKLHCQNDY
jgi:hypothetical protein